MLKIIIAPDSFKGTLSAREAAEIMSRAAGDILPDAEIITVPIADGGEGTIEALHAHKIYTVVNNPYFEPIHSYYGDYNGSAVIESAVCCGLPLVAERKNPALTSTYGVGELIKQALDDGYRNIIIALGGSSTNDAGCGMAAALGVRFTGKNGDLIPTGKTLGDIEHIDMSQLDFRIRQTEITAMCDITNPLYGINGAAYVFAPQKGAKCDEVKLLDDGLRHISKIIQKDLSMDISMLEGSGAAGGMGAGVMAFLGGTLKSGIENMLHAADFDRLLYGASLVITGEGHFDSQSIKGKVISGIAGRTQKLNIPLIVVAGSVEEVNNCYDMGITSVFSIQRTPLPFNEAVLRTKSDLYAAVNNIIRTFIASK